MDLLPPRTPPALSAQDAVAAVDKVEPLSPPPPYLSVGKGATAMGGPREGVSVAKGDAVSLDFADADVAAVARAVLGDSLHLSYTIDPRVTGKVTLQTSAPVARDAVLSLLEDAFRMNGAAIVESNGQFAVVPADASRFSMGSTRMGPARGPGWRTQIVPLRFASAAQVQKSLEVIAPAGTSVHADPAHNALILTGSGTEIANLLDAIAAFDNDVMTNKSFGLLPLRVADARSIVSELEAVFGHAEAGDDFAPVRFLPIQRLNALLVIARDGTTLRQAQDWIARLDQIGDSDEDQLFVYRVRSGRASYLADLLIKLYPEHTVEKVGTEHGTSSAGGNKPVVAPLAPMSPSTAMKPDGRTAQTDQSNPNGIALSPLPTDSEPSKGSGVRIVADASNNTLLIQARPAVYRRIEKSLNKLDVVPAQVSVEATIVEVTLNNTLHFGTQFFLNAGKRNAFQFTPNVDNSVGAVAPGFSYIWSAGGAKGVIDALSSVTNVNVVSSPTMMMMDNETAQLQVGDQVPIITSTSQSTLTSGAPIISQVEYHDTGVILTVTPRITSGGTILLDVQQEVSQVVSTTSSSIDSPSFQQRRFHSSVAVTDGETLALGGLIQNSRTKNTSGIPLLSDIPYLGAVFGDRGDSVDRTELMVLITPHVVRNQAEAEAATAEIRHRIEDTVVLKPGVLP